MKYRKETIPQSLIVPAIEQVVFTLTYLSSFDVYHLISNEHFPQALLFVIGELIGRYISSQYELSIHRDILCWVYILDGSSKPKGEALYRNGGNKTNVMIRNLFLSKRAYTITT